MGIYFQDMLDFIYFYCGLLNCCDRRSYFFGKTIPKEETFSCIGSEIYYSLDKKKNIYYDDQFFEFFIRELDHFPMYQEIKRHYPDKMVEKF